MKLALQLAYKNLVGAGLRTWLNVAVLSFSFLVIIFFNGILDGWNNQAKKDSVAWEFGHGHLQHESYDPLDPFSIQDGHGIYDGPGKELLNPVLVRQGSIYPEGRMLSVVLKGIAPEQHVLELPTGGLDKEGAGIPAVIGEGMAESAGLGVGDRVLLRWRDRNGTFDATDIEIVEVFKANVPTVDRGQVWIALDDLWEMTGLEGHATYLVAEEGFEGSEVNGWTFQSQETLLKDITEIITAKKASSSIMYILLLAIALLAIFDTQVLSVFRRQREIGTYISLGMTRQQVVGLFTVEGSMYSLFAMVLGSIVGAPLFAFLAFKGIAFPASSQDFGVAMADKIYPAFGLQMVLMTILLVVIAATIVSYLPSRKISKMNPVDALKGKLQ